MLEKPVKGGQLFVNGFFTLLSACNSRQSVRCLKQYSKFIVKVGNIQKLIYQRSLNSKNDNNKQKLFKTILGKKHSSSLHVTGAL